MNKKTKSLNALIITAMGKIFRMQYKNLDTLKDLRYNSKTKFFLELPEIIEWFRKQGCKLKECSLCHDKFPAHLTYFFTHTHTRDKLQSNCRVCFNNTYRQNNEEWKVIGSDAYNWYTYCQLKSHHINPDKGGGSFPIETFYSFEEHVKVIEAARDPKTGKYMDGYNLEVELVCAKGKATDKSPSFDRKDNSKGYEKGNVILVSLLSNRIKGDMTESQIKNLSQGIIKQGSGNEQKNN